jgi:8-oxo-dGTP diphosphatase
MADAADVRRIALALPGVEEIDSDGFDFRVGGKGFIWSYPERRPGKPRLIRTDIAVLFVGDEAEKQALLLGEPGTFFTTPGYDGWPLVMLRLAEVDVERLAELVTDAWRMRAPEALAGELGRMVSIDTVAWVRLESGRILCARPRGKDIFYIPGGKREGAESDLQTLLREIAEELTVALLPETVTHVGTYEADQPDGAVVRMSCYAGDYAGTLAASSEIDELAWFSYADRPRVPAVDQLLFDDLKASGELR